MLQIQLKAISVNNDEFPKYPKSIYVSIEDANRLGISEDDLTYRSQIYARIESTQLGNIFEIIAPLTILNKANSTQSGFAFVSKSLLPGNHTIGTHTFGELSVYDLEGVEKSEKVFITLPKDKVANWSQEEIDNAIMHIKRDYAYLYKGQKIYAKPETKNVVIAEVTEIYPLVNIEGRLRYVKTADIVLEGVPDSRQTVIEFSDIGGLDEPIRKVREIIQIPLTLSEYTGKVRLQTPKGMLLYGPPGNGKTMIARALAQSMGSDFIQAELHELLSKFVGNGEKYLREQFAEASRRDKCVLFIDEIDAIASARLNDSTEHHNSLVATLLDCMDGLKSNNQVFVIGATNRLNSIDPALRRPGRFDLEIEIPLPDEAARRDILSKYLKIDSSDFYSDDVNQTLIDNIVNATNGYSGADFKMLYQEACMNALRKVTDIDDGGKVYPRVAVDDFKVSASDFLHALQMIVPTSMRSASKRNYSTSWKELLGLDDQKLLFEKIHSDYIKLTNDSFSSIRPSFANLCITGRNGCGKHTFLNAFSEYYGYELVTINLMDLTAMREIDATDYIVSSITKARQLSPSVVLIENAEKVSNNDLYLNLIIEQSYKLNCKQRVIFVLLSESDKYISNHIGYKKFNKSISFEKDINELNEVFKDFPSAKEMVNQGLTIGEILSKMNENRILA